MRFRLLIPFTLAVATMLSVTGAGARAAPADGPSGEYGLPTSSDSDGARARTALYIIELADAPLATYTGGVSSFKATSPTVTGALRLQTASPASRAYAAHLDREQDALTASLVQQLDRPVNTEFRYRNVLNGLAVRLTPEEAATVRRLPQVTAVTRDARFAAHTDSGPGWIGAPGVWDGSAVPGGVGSMGEGVIVGILDTGINMDHPSFAAMGDDGYVHENPFGSGNYKGFCDPEHPLHDPARWVCNDKLVGAWSWEIAGNDPEDDGGHGTHTAGTTAGNFLNASLRTPTMAITLPLQGVAPHANIISYDMAEGGWATIATMAAAIDQSVDDGVHVLNMSFGPNITEADPWYENHLYGQAYLNAQAAGVLVSVSAGNSGPRAGSTAAIAPWMAATAASTHNRVVQNVLEDMSGGDSPPPADLVGKSMSGGYGPAPIVSAVGRLKSDGTPDDGRCLTAFPAGTFDGEIVVCIRGVIARTAKGTNVMQGGAGGLVLLNTAAEGNGTNGDAHELPAVHLGYDAGQLLAAWMASGTGHMATISGMLFSRDEANGDVLAGFSSRGPSWMGTCCLRPTDIEDWEVGGFFGTRSVDVLKPDVTAPGVDIWAAWATNAADPSPEPEYIAISGTSMSSPHHAGAMALLRAVQPTWSVNEIRSALMTTAVTEGVRRQDGITPATPFDVGAGRINVSYAASAGFVLDESPTAMAAASPLAGGAPSTLNLASMANFSCVGTCSWTRTLKGTHDNAVEWAITASGANSVTLAVDPPSVTLAAGETATVTVTADVSGADIGAYGFGRVDFAPDTTAVPAGHMPVAVRAVEVALPPSVMSEVPVTAVIRSFPGLRSVTLDGWVARDVANLWVESGGIVLAEVAQAELASHPDADPFESVTTTVTSLMQVADASPRLVAEISSTAALNVDLYVGRDTNGDGLAQEDEVVCASTGGVWTEMCDIRDPEPGSWWVLVHNAGSSEPSAIDTVTYRYGAVDPDPLYFMVVLGPDSVVQGVPFDIEVHADDFPDAFFAPGGVAYGSFSLLDTDSREVLVTVGVDILFDAGYPIFIPAVPHGEPE